MIGEKGPEFVSPTVNCRCVMTPRRAGKTAKLEETIRMRVADKVSHLADTLAHSMLTRTPITTRIPHSINPWLDEDFGQPFTKGDSDMTIFKSKYADVMRDCMRNGVQEKNARTGVEIKMAKTPFAFAIDLESGRVPVPSNRRYYPHIAAAEVAWQFMGTKDPAFIVGKAPKLWSKFVEDGELKTAYGYRWREHFGRDQLLLAIEELQSNPTNRQLFVSAWDPSIDGLGGPQPKNIPCPIGFSLTVVEGKLNMSVFVRSSDVFVGLPYDTMAYALTLDAIAATTGLKLGTLHMTLAHPHVYEPHWKFCDDRGMETGGSQEPTMPGWTLQMIEDAPDEYVATVKRLNARLPWRSKYDPMPELIE